MNPKNKCSMWLSLVSLDHIIPATTDN
jgi:hypothetical protein